MSFARTAKPSIAPADKPASQVKCGRCHKPLFGGKPFPVSGKSFAVDIQHNDIPVVADFWADWCGPCKVRAPAFERIAVELEPEIRFLEVDTEAERDLAARYHIRSIPMLMLFRKGRIVAQRAGASDAPSLRAWILVRDQKRQGSVVHHLVGRTAKQPFG